VVALACVLAYTGYQTYECYLSYTNPDWHSSLPTLAHRRLRSYRSFLRFALLVLSVFLFVCGSAGRPA